MSEFFDEGLRAPSEQDNQRIISVHFESDLDAPDSIANDENWTQDGAYEGGQYGTRDRFYTYREQREGDPAKDLPTNTLDSQDYVRAYYQRIGGNFVIQQSGGYGDFWSGFQFSDHADRYPNAPYRPERLSVRVGGNDRENGFNNYNEILLRDQRKNPFVRFYFPHEDGDGSFIVNGREVEANRNNGLYHVNLRNIDWDNGRFDIEVYRQTLEGYGSSPIFRRTGVRFRTAEAGGFDEVWTHAYSSGHAYLDALEFPAGGGKSDSTGKTELLINPSFENDLRGWTVKDPQGPEQTPGHVEATGLAAKMIVEGAPSTIFLVQELHQDFPRGSTFTLDVETGGDLDCCGGFLVYLSKDPNRLSSGQKEHIKHPDDGSHTLTIVADRDYEAGDFLRLRTSIWPGKGHTLVNDVSWNEAATGTRTPTQAPTPTQTPTETPTETPTPTPKQAKLSPIGSYLFRPVSVDNREYLVIWNLNDFRDERRAVVYKPKEPAADTLTLAPPSETFDALIADSWIDRPYTRDCDRLLRVARRNRQIYSVMELFSRASSVFGEWAAAYAMTTVSPTVATHVATEALKDSILWAYDEFSNPYEDALSKIAGLATTDQRLKSEVEDVTSAVALPAEILDFIIALQGAADQIQSTASMISAMGSAAINSSAGTSSLSAALSAGGSAAVAPVAYFIAGELVQTTVEAGVNGYEMEAKVAALGHAFSTLRLPYLRELKRYQELGRAGKLTPGMAIHYQLQEAHHSLMGAVANAAMHKYAREVSDGLFGSFYDILVNADEIAKSSRQMSQSFHKASVSALDVLQSRWSIAERRHQQSINIERIHSTTSVEGISAGKVSNRGDDL